MRQERTGYAHTLERLGEQLRISRTSTRNLRRDGLRRLRSGYSFSEAAHLLKARALRVAHLRHGSEAIAEAKMRKLAVDADFAELALAKLQGHLVLQDDAHRAWRICVIN